MKHLKLLGLAAVVAMTLVALPAEDATAGSVFCTTKESPCPEANRWAAGTELDLSIASGQSSLLVNTKGEPLDTCTGSTAKGKIEKPEAVTASIESLTWSGCTFTTTTLKAGKLEVTHIAGTHNGTVKADGPTEVTINTVFFGTCVYGFTAGTDIGELKEGKPATVVANAVPEKFTGSNFACPETAKWTAEYTLTEPKEKTLSVELNSKAVLCSTQEWPCLEANTWPAGTSLDFSLKSGTSAQLTNTEGTEVLETCSESTAKWKLEAAEEITGSLQALSWGSCTFPTTTTQLGKLEISRINATHNGTVTSTQETKFTINGGFFGSCLYGASSGTDLGELKEGKPAVLVVNAVVSKLSGSAAACPETAKWTAEYTLTEPSEKTLVVESAPGSVFCTTQESPCPEANRWAAGTELDFSLKSGTNATLVNTKGEELDQCSTSTAKGKMEKAEEVTGPIETLTWSGCTFTTTTLKAGKLEISNIAGTHNGTVKADGTTEVTINTVWFGSCIYGVTAGVDLGELKEGKPAIFVVNAVVEKFAGSAFTCPETAKWTGTYTLTEPKEKTLSVESG